MTPLRAKMIRDMELQRLAPKTQKAYIAAVAGLAKFYGRSPAQLLPDQIRAYLHHLLGERHLAWRSCNQVACGLKFFYVTTLGWDALHLNLPPRMGRRLLPQLMSVEELQRLFTSAANPRNRALLMTTYAAGLRVGEVVRLRLSDIESDRMLIRVNQGKGRQDRDTLLSARLLTALRTSWSLYRPAPWLLTGHDRTQPLAIATAQKISSHFERYAYSSCRNRHCPKCQTWATAQWVEAQRAELLPTPYFHTVFTVPYALNGLILANKRLLLTLLFRTVSQTLLQFGQQNLGGQLGATMVLHTWDQTLNAHFHLHCLVPAGALAEDGPRWVPTHPRFLFPVRALRTVFRAKFLAAFQQAYTKEALRCAQVSARCDSSTGFLHLLDQLYNQAWVVYAKRPCAGPTQVLEYLGRSIHRVAIDHHRLLEVRDGCVRFTCRNRRQGTRVHTMTLEAHEFRQRFVLPIVPHGCQRLRHVGFLANRCQARPLRQCRHLRGQPTDPPPRAPPRAVARMRQRTGLDLTPCPQCGHGPLGRSPRPPLTGRAPGQEASATVLLWDSS